MFKFVSKIFFSKCNYEHVPNGKAWNQQLYQNVFSNYQFGHKCSNDMRFISNLLSEATVLSPSYIKKLWENRIFKDQEENFQNKFLQNLFSAIYQHEGIIQSITCKACKLCFIMIGWNFEKSKNEKELQLANMKMVTRKGPNLN